MIEYKVKNKIESPDFGDVKLGGYVSELAERFFYNRITSDFAKNVVYKETEDAFRNKIDDETIVGIWQGEYWGKWIISASRVCRYHADEELKSFIRQAAHNLISLQEPNGYIGTYRDSLNMFAPTVEEAKRVCGMGVAWNWNLWCRKYTLWGLVEAYTLTSDEEILEAAKRFASHLIGELADNNIDIRDTGTFFGLPTGSIMKPMTLLYEITGEKEYLDFAVSIADKWNDTETGRCPNLIANAFSGRPLYEWYPSSVKWTKAYEMISCLDGLLELYRVTGTALYFDAVRAIYELLYKYELNTVLSVGYNDLFANASSQQNALSEPCDVIHWMRLSYELFRLTGESRYMDIFEYAFYNPFLAAIDHDGKWGARCVRSSVQHFPAPPQAKMKYSHCCINNMPRGFMNMAQAAVMRGADGIYVNLFTPVKVLLGGATVEVGGEYLSEGKAMVAVTGAGDTPVFIRIPEWSRTTVVGGETTKTRGAFFRVDGKERFEVVFDRELRVSRFPEKVERLDANDWRVKRWANSDITSDGMVWERGSTAMIGPLLLAKGGGGTHALCECELDGVKLRDYATAGKYLDGEEHNFSVIL